MSAESVVINSRGYTDELYETCGDQRCTAAILEAVGVNMAGREPADVHREDVGDGVRISVLRAGETDYDVWCAACGEFLHHGLECACPADEDGVQQDLAPREAPHINLKDVPSIRQLWN